MRLFNLIALVCIMLLPGVLLKADTRNILIDKSTRQILSVGDFSVDNPVIEELVPYEGKLPQDTDPDINIQDYRLRADGKTFIYNPDGNVVREKRRQAQMNKSIIRALIKFLANHNGMTPQQVKNELKSYLE